MAEPLRHPAAIDPQQQGRLGDAQAALHQFSDLMGRSLGRRLRGRVRILGQCLGSGRPAMFLKKLPLDSAQWNRRRMGHLRQLYIQLSDELLTGQPDMMSGQHLIKAHTHTHAHNLSHT